MVTDSARYVISPGIESSTRSMDRVAPPVRDALPNSASLQSTLQPCCSRNRAVTVGSCRDGLRWPTCVSNPTSSPSSPRPRRSRSRPRDRTARPTGRSSGSSSMATTSSSVRSTAPTARWYREAIANPSVTIHAGGRALPARVDGRHRPDIDPRERATPSTRKYTGITGAAGDARARTSSTRRCGSTPA